MAPRPIKYLYGGVSNPSGLNPSAFGLLSDVGRVDVGAARSCRPDLDRVCWSGPTGSAARVIWCFWRRCRRARIRSSTKRSSAPRSCEAAGVDAIFLAGGATIEAVEVMFSAKDPANPRRRQRPAGRPRLAGTASGPGLVASHALAAAAFNAFGRNTACAPTICC